MDLSKLTTTFEITKAALKAYDEDAPAREARWHATRTNEDVEAAEKADAESVEKVHQAFWEDTKSQNSLANVRHLSVRNIREAVGLPTPPASVTIGAVEFGHSEELRPISIMGRERADLLQMVQEGKDLPRNLVPIRRVFMHGWQIVDRESIIWGNM